MMNNFKIECVKLLKHLAFSMPYMIWETGKMERRKQNPKQIKRWQTKPEMIHIHGCSVEQNEWICWWRWHLRNIQSVTFSVLNFTRVNWLHPSDRPMGRHIFNDNCFVSVVKKKTHIKMKFAILTIFKSTVRCCLVSQSCLTLCDLMDGSPHQAPLSMEWTVGWVSVCFPRGVFPTQGSNLSLLHCRQNLHRWASGQSVGLGVLALFQNTFAGLCHLSRL